MVKLNKIYTRTGDKGTTMLTSGERVAKSDLRIAAYGSVDETNATVGLARLHTSGELDKALERIQNDLFDLGADLSTTIAPDEEAGQALRITGAQVERLEGEIDAMNEAMAPLTSFVLPGGTPAAGFLHQARTVARRAERLMSELAQREPGGVNEAALRYINRLSDHFFVASRAANENGAKDVLWTPGANR